MCRTNRLIDIRDYARTYRNMKNSIGRQLAEQWTEQTDPQKFVFEDCGIVSYLLVRMHFIVHEEDNLFAGVVVDKGKQTVFLCRPGLWQWPARTFAQQIGSEGLWTRCEEKGHLVSQLTQFLSSSMLFVAGRP